MNASDWLLIDYFKPKEFDSPDSPGSGMQMDLGFMRKLDRMRSAAGIPFAIHSGLRTAARNALVGGVDSSSHEIGLAADVGAISSATRFKVLGAAFAIGFHRIGIGATFIHVDDDVSKPQGVAWRYDAAVVRS